MIRLSAYQLVPKSPPHDLADIRLREFAPEVDVARHLVPGERPSAVLDEIIRREVWIPLDDEQRDNLAGARIGLRYRRCFQNSGVSDRNTLNLVGIYVEA